MLYIVLLEIQQTFQQRKNFENPLRFDEAIVTYRVARFSETQCASVEQNPKIKAMLF